MANMTEAEIKKRISQPKTKRGKRALAEKAPKFFENLKQQVVLRGTKTSPIINEALRDLHKMCKPNSKALMRRLDCHPFEDLSSIEFLCDKNDTSLFVFGSHTKKRPHNLIFGRCFNNQMLDMFEFGIDPNTFKPMDHFNRLRDENSCDGGDKSYGIGSKPCLIFQGEAFNNDNTLKKMRNLWLDFYRGETLSKINLLTVDHVITFTGVSFQTDGFKDASSRPAAVDENSVCVLIRHYHVELQHSNDPKRPYIHLFEIGPRLDLYSRREEHASEEMQEAARVRPSRVLTSKKPKQKNVKHNVLGERVGKLYINRNDQNLAKLKIKKMKALKRNFEKPQQKKTSTSSDKIDKEGI